MALTQNDVRVWGIVDAGIGFVWGIYFGVVGICCVVSNHGSVDGVGTGNVDDDPDSGNGDLWIVISKMRSWTSSMNLNSKNLIFGGDGENLSENGAKCGGAI